EPGILAKVFKVSSIHWRAVDVHPRPQQKVDAFRPRIAANLRPDAFGQRGIPGGGQGNAARHRSRWSKVAYPDGTVSHLQPRQVEPRHAADKKTVNASNQVDLLFQSHLTEQILDASIDGRLLIFIDIHAAVPVQVNPGAVIDVFFGAVPGSRQAESCLSYEEK